ncbi:uncharacterized protein M437DRAFT_60689 [Aureobasidium melanogenum CBS 110374]|uniref:Zn(2)-C6 fungal-type domain-containing protein n=1 Tax=Aureobasidium melanogenum (strain CBS 110374) TaxID=1043003 RepID=A0A074VJV3_AURM1|nr:uncharacterized protein M437DRAFT_60689 [Aureobasidium melanogenum CBS 110374]KEQ57907.1 hypothetical protein M437DRAFT_60689 [Aureobasidium melanogenum CBS 110374]
MDIAARRKNVSIACDACRSRKRKCDGTLPICTACLDCEKQCTYSEDKRSSTKRRQYGGQRVQDLEDQAATAGPAPVTTMTRIDGTATTQELMNTIHKELEDSQREQESITPDHALAVTDNLKRLPDALEDLSHMLWTLDVLDSGETYFKGPSGNFCFSATKAPPQIQHNVKQEIADVYVTYTLMSQHLREMLALFMKHVNPFYQFLDADGLSQVTIEPSMPLPSQLLYASVISAGALFTSDPHARNSGRTIAAFAENIAVTCCRDHPSITVLRALSILSWMNTGLGNDSMGYMFNHMAMSMVVHLGIHATSLPELKPRKTIDERTQSTRVRAFWSALQCRLWYITDQHMDQIYSFEFGRLDTTSKHRLLINARDALLGFRKYMAESALPSLQDSTSAQKVLHLAYHVSLILVHRPFLHADNDWQTRCFALRTTTTAADASSRIVKMLIASPKCSKLPYFVIHHVLTVALAHLLNATCDDSRVRQRAVTGVRVCLKALESLGQTWGNAAARSIVEIQRLAAKWKIGSILPRHLDRPFEQASQDDLPSVAASDDSERDPYSATSSDSTYLDQINNTEFSDALRDGINIYGQDCPKANDYAL